MTGKQDITALATALAAGVAIGLYAIGHLRSALLLYTLASASFSITIILIARLFLSGAKRISGLIPLYISTGILCSLACSISSSGSISETGILNRIASLTRTAIMSMPFKSETTAPLINALVTGDKSWLDKSLLTAFRESGASHILALSGLHLGIIYGILLKLTSVMGNSPRIRIVKSLAIVLFATAYTLATGVCPSLVRALLFIILNETAKLLHRESKPMQVFCAALMLQLILNPTALDSVGFQLSYLAMAGIILLYPRLKSWYPSEETFDTQSNAKANVFSKLKLQEKFNLPRKIWDASALTISCQIFTGPLAWLTFGTFPRYFLLTNILALPVTSILMTSAFVSVTLYIAGICPQILLDTTDCAASALIFIMQTISTM